jgi:hypothetical protein
MNNFENEKCRRNRAGYSKFKLLRNTYNLSKFQLTIKKIKK